MSFVGFLAFGLGAFIQGWGSAKMHRKIECGGFLLTLAGLAVLERFGGFPWK